MSLSLDECRSYLRFLAETQLDRRLQRRLDPSDIVQETLLQAHRGRNDFRGEETPQYLAWLKRILMRNILHALRDAQCDKRDIRREKDLAMSVDRSSRFVEQWLAADQTDPQRAVENAEESYRVAVALQEVPEPQRSAVIGYYWRQQSLAEIGDDLGKSAAAAAGLVHRGMRRLQQILDEGAQTP
jgi:RNA polymerase sigma-70 factor (ECF subfamily)